MNTRALTATLPALAIATATTPHAHAQDALGDGTALDANQQLGSGGRNAPQRDFASEIRFRNAIVTGNANAALDFRGDVGYTSEFDFRADTGSDLVFDFERETLSSGLATVGIRGIEGLRTQLGLTSDFSTQGRAPITFSGPGAGAAAVQAQQPGPRPGGDIFNQLDGTLRSTSRALTRATQRPQTLGFRRDQDGQPNALVASTLTGVRELAANNPALIGPVGPDASFDLREILGQENIDASVGLDTPDDFTIPDNIQDPALTPEDDTPPTLDDPSDVFLGNRNRNNAIDNTEQQPQPTNTNREENRVQNQTQARTSETNRIVNQPLARTSLLTRLTEPTPRQPTNDQPADGTTEDTTTPAEPNQPQPFEQPTNQPTEPTAEQLQQTESLLRNLSDRLRQPQSLDSPLIPSRDDDAIEDAAAEEQKAEDETERAIQLIRRNRTTIDNLAPQSDESASAFASHMRFGQQWLKQQRWFDAEERFTAALTIDPNSLEAEVGRINAQIGAGLYTSAALNLRFLFRDYPELTTVRYDDALLPSGDRLDDILSELQQRLQEPPRTARDAALLLAFLGFQTERSTLINDAFNRIRELNQQTNTDPDPLTQLLERVWTE